MIRVAVSGAAGRMGRMVMEAVGSADGLDLAAGYDPEQSGAIVGGVVVSADPGVVAGADVVVEFTNPAVVMTNIAEWHRRGASVVVGTSGFDAPRIEEVLQAWTTGPPNCLIVPNFSIGAVVMIRLAEIAAPYFAASEVVELHHDRKADAPSGTALATAARIEAAGGHHDRAVDSVESLPGARGADAGSRIHSIRLPGLLAHHEVLFGGPGETLTIRHDTLDRQSFMPGVLLAVRSVQQLPDPVTVGLDSLLGI